jgi:hypothetical protein
MTARFDLLNRIILAAMSRALVVAAVMGVASARNNLSM